MKMLSIIKPSLIKPLLSARTTIKTVAPQQKSVTQHIKLDHSKDFFTHITQKSPPQHPKFGGWGDKADQLRQTRNGTYVETFTSRGTSPAPGGVLTRAEFQTRYGKSPERVQQEERSRYQVQAGTSYGRAYAPPQYLPQSSAVPSAFLPQFPPLPAAGPASQQSVPVSTPSLSRAINERRMKKTKDRLDACATNIATAQQNIATAQQNIATAQNSLRVGHDIQGSSSTIATQQAYIGQMQAYTVEQQELWRQTKAKDDYNEAYVRLGYNAKEIPEGDESAAEEEEVVKGKGKKGTTLKDRQHKKTSKSHHHKKKTSKVEGKGKGKEGAYIETDSDSDYD